MLDVLTEEHLPQAVAWLCQRDEALHRVVTQFGNPPLWARQPGFATLVHIILEQQVSLASAKAAYDKLQHKIKKITPKRVLALSDEDLKAAGFSRQKAAYARHLAQAIESKTFDPKKLMALPDADVRTELVKLKGIGNWTADIYLLMCLRRPNIFPHGDLALAIAAHQFLGLTARPSYDELDDIAAERWQPYRAVAARILWHGYLCKKS